MTVAAQNPAVAYTGNGVTTVFAYTMRILDATYLKVYLDGVLQVGGYTVDGVNNPTGGNVTFAVAPGNGVAVLFQRNTAQDQQVDYTPYDAFPSETHETALDKLTMLVQEGISGANHAITIPPNETTITQLPSAAVRANGFVAFDGAGNVIVAAGASSVPVSPFMATLLDDATAAAARATLDVPSNSEAILDTIVDAKGDLIVGTAADTVARRAAPANGSIIVADSTQASGWRDQLFGADDQEDIATAATPAIFASLKRVIRLTGTTDITAFDAGALGSWRLVHVQSTGARLVNGANLQNPLPFDIQMMAGDSFIVEALGGGVSKIHNYTRADGQVLLGGRIPTGMFLTGILNAAASATSFCAGMGVTAVAEANGVTVIPADCTLSDLRIVASAALAGGTAVITVRKNGADTALTCTLAAASGTTASDLTHTVDFSAGDLLAVKIVTGAIGATTDFGISFAIKKRGLQVGVPTQFCFNSTNVAINVGSVLRLFTFATEADAEFPVPPCRIVPRSVVRADSGTVGTFYGPTLRKNAGYPNGTQHSTPLAIGAAGTSVGMRGVAGYPQDYVEGDLYNARGTITDSDAQYNEGWFDALGPTDRQYPAALLNFLCLGQVQNVTRYAGAYAGSGTSWQSATESDVQVPVPVAGTLRNLRVSSSTTIAATTTVVTVRKNGVDTGLTCTLTTSGRLASDLVNSVAFAAGDLLTVKVVSGATTGTRTYNITIEANPA